MCKMLNHAEEADGLMNQTHSLAIGLDRSQIFLPGAGKDFYL
jgi:hypothetical protein